MAGVIVGMSGGVDSAVTAYLLKAAGHDVAGVTLRTWLADGSAGSRCCEIDDARAVAAVLQIPYYVHSCAELFRREVAAPFVEDYLHGLTPNPCVRCNRTVKWDELLRAAAHMGAGYAATGHYASVVRKENGRYTVKKAACAEKDQTYMLYQLTQEQLAHTLMPLGGLSKDEVRAIAAGAGLPVAQKKDSQEICFVTEGGYADYIESFEGAEPPPEGDFVDEEGHVIGRHRGIIHYTVGQRRGLGIALGYPAYVKQVDAEANRVVIGREESLYSDEIQCRDLHYMSILGLREGEKLRMRVKIRYQHAGEWAEAEALDGGRVKLCFDRPVRAAAPGQSAVFYDAEDCVIGGGVIV